MKNERPIAAADLALVERRPYTFTRGHESSRLHHGLPPNGLPSDRSTKVGSCIGDRNVTTDERELQQPPEISVVIPWALRSLCKGRTELTIAATNLRNLVAELTRLHPEVYRSLFDERGEPRPHINVFVNYDHLRALAGLESKLKAGDVVSFLPAVSGG